MMSTLKEMEMKIIYQKCSYPHNALNSPLSFCLVDQSSHLFHGVHLDIVHSCYHITLVMIYTLVVMYDQQSLPLTFWRPAT